MTKAVAKGTWLKALQNGNEAASENREKILHTHTDENPCYVCTECYKNPKADPVPYTPLH